MDDFLFKAKASCKDCYGRGFIMRSLPTGRNKKKVVNKTLCHCATEIKKPEPDECVVPKVVNGPKPIEYASSAIPDRE